MINIIYYSYSYDFLVTVGNFFCDSNLAESIHPNKFKLQAFLCLLNFVHKFLVIIRTIFLVEVHMIQIKLLLVITILDMKSKAPTELVVYGVVYAALNMRIAFFVN